MKKLIASTLCLVLVLSLCACGDAVIPSSKDAAVNSNAKQIILKTDSIEADSGVRVAGTTATITNAGEYAVSGSLENGQIVVNTGDVKGKVTLILNNCSISNPDAAAIMVERAESVKIILPTDSENTLTSGTEAYNHTELSSGAVIEADDDLKLDGEGKLTINGYINNGISSKNDIDVNGGEIIVHAVNNALRGADSVEIDGGVLTLYAGNDGIKSTTLDKEGKGYISITGGCIDITSQGDGISSEKELTISGGVLNILTEGDPQYASSKALKAKSGMTISGGCTELKTNDNAISCTGNFAMSSGVLTIESGADGIRCKGIDSVLSLSGGCIEISSLKKCFDVDGTLEAQNCALIALGNYKNLPSYDGLKVSSHTGKAGEKQEMLIARFDFNTVITN